MKSTHWTELDAERISIIERCETIALTCESVIIKAGAPGVGTLQTIHVIHPELKRSLWFQMSEKGNWYWRSTGKRRFDQATGYIIKGKLSI